MNNTDMFVGIVMMIMQLKDLSILVNEEYLREYYQALGYIISIKDTGISARVEISWMEE